MVFFREVARRFRNPKYRIVKVDKMDWYGRYDRTVFKIEKERLFGGWKTVDVYEDPWSDSSEFKTEEDAVGRLSVILGKKLAVKTVVAEGFSGGNGHG